MVDVLITSTATVFATAATERFIRSGDFAGRTTVSYINSGLAVAVLNFPGASASFGGFAAGDTFFGVGVNDIIGSNFDDYLQSGGSGATIVDGAAGADYIVTGDFADTLTGGEGDDILSGGAGADILDGGNGADVAAYFDALTGVTIDLATPGNNAGDAAGDTYISIEAFYGSGFADLMSGTDSAEVFVGGLGDDTLIGLGGGDYLEGVDGDDLLNGGLGADTLVGGGGIDTATYANATAGVTVDLVTPGNNTGEAQGDFLVEIENLIGSDFADKLVAGAGANVLAGGGGDDTLTGGAGADRLDGGKLGNDTADYSTATTAVTASLSTPAANTGDAQGDTYFSIENLSGSTFDDTLTGNGGANMLSGSGGDDNLIGLTDADTLDGGSGTDTAVYTGGSVIADLAAPSNNTGDAEGDVYISIENLSAGSGEDQLSGDAGDNYLSGGDGNDLLMGRAGADTLDGGNDIDTATYTPPPPASCSIWPTRGTAPATPPAMSSWASRISWRPTSTT